MQFERDSSWRRRVIWTGLSILLIGAFLFQGVVFEHIRGRRALEQYRKDLRAQGEKLTLAELNPPKVPKVDNGMAELLAVPGELSRLKETCPLISWGVFASIQCPVPGKGIVFGDLDELPGFLGGLEKSESYGWSDVETELLKGDAALRKARAAIQQPVLVAELDYAQGILLTTSHLGPMRLVARWLAASAVVHQRQGDRVAAIEDIRSLARLARALENEPLILSQLSRVAIESIGMNATWQILPAPGWTDDQLGQLQECWCERESLKCMVRAWEVERAMHCALYSDIRKTPQKFLDLIRSYSRSGGSFSSSLDISARIALIKGWALLWSHQDELQFLQYYQTALEGARRVNRSHSYADGKRTFDSLQLSIETAPRFHKIKRPLCYLIMPAMGRGMEAVSHGETQRALTETAIALKRHRLANGSYPVDLAALVPQYLPQLPKDCMDGKPLRYRLASDGTFVLYSVGSNLTDEGGDATGSISSGYLGLMWNGCDVVWPWPASKEEAEKYIREHGPPSKSKSLPEKKK